MPGAMASSTVLVAGGGVFGLTGALELRRRGFAVTLVDPGPIPHPLAASTDISKVMRIEYGADEDYMRLGEDALAGWRAARDGLFHETGVLFLRRTPLAPGTFEGDSLRLLRKRGHRPEPLDAAALRARFPAWNADAYPHGFFHAAGGFVESGEVAARLAARARREGVGVREGVALARLLERRGRVTGVETAAGERIEADRVVLALGAWTPHLLPELAPHFRTPGLPVFHLKPADPAPFLADRFPVFTADVSTTGYYGFPLHPRHGVVKIANHGPGRLLHPESPERVVTEEETARMRSFLREALPALAEAPVVATRICLYCDTPDGHFWITPVPGRAGLVLATGGCGHALKFAPALGALVADAVEGRRKDFTEKFRWRPEARPARSEEAARWQG